MLEATSPCVLRLDTILSVRTCCHLSIKCMLVKTDTDLSYIEHLDSSNDRETTGIFFSSFEHVHVTVARCLRLKTKSKTKETLLPAFRQRESRFFFFFMHIGGSKDNYTEYPVNCRWAAHPSSHLRCPNIVTELQRAFLYFPQVPKFKTGSDASESRRRAPEDGISSCSWRNAWPFVKHSHYRQWKRVREATRGGEVGGVGALNRSSACVGTAVNETLCVFDKLWGASVTVALSAGSLWGGDPGPCNCSGEDAGRLTSCSSGGKTRSERSA